TFEWFRQARYAWDAVANSWNQWVLGYNPDRQVRFLSQFGMAEVTWQNMVIVLAAVSGMIILALSLALLLRLNSHRPDPVQRAYAAYCNTMAKRGAARRMSEGPRDFAARVSLQFPELRETAQKITALYISMRYGEGADRGNLQALHDAIRMLKSTA
ncbi:MAG TPA: DUF4129 domain-containing protein, partial [Aggregatilineales bacterium]|nr:DUF4129 domain-containing protein [Aggregatilineales bacterium]